MTALLAAENLGHAYGRRVALGDVSLGVAPGQALSILGPNGGGKTTLLKLLLGLARPQSGRVLLDGQDMAGLSAKNVARRLAYVPQNHRPAFAYAVLEVVLMGRLPHKPFWLRFGKADEALALAALERLGIGHLARRPYTDLSGGERQLTLIARALAQDAAVLILDEPASGLDYGAQLRLLERLRALADEGRAIVQSTHFPDHALWIGGRAALLRRGRIIAEGPADQVIDGKNLQRLYDCPIGVESLPGGGRICAPRNLGRPAPAEAPAAIGAISAGRDKRQ